MGANRFSSEYTSLTEYILGITYRIWEGRDLALIRRYYSDDCWVMTPSGIVIGVEPVITGTRATLAMFPDRELLGEDVIFADHGKELGNTRGFLSSHRIMSPMTHLGAGMFGPATGRRLFVRTIADCLVVGDIITEEWLVRDQGAIAAQTGTSSEALGRAFAEADSSQGHAASSGRTPWQIDQWNAVQAGQREHHAVLQAHPAAAAVREQMGLLFTPAVLTMEPDELAARYDRAVNLHLPEARFAAGWPALLAFVARYVTAFPDLRLVIDHSIACDEPGRPIRVSTRWRLAGTHLGEGAYGVPSGAKILILGITHSELAGGRVMREFWLVDETAIWRQIHGKIG